MSKQKAEASKNSKCGLCNKKKKLIKTPCCNNWICDDEDKYIIFSFARNSCYRNHDRFTLCSYHCHEEHLGNWKTCKKCKESFETEMYVWYGTNEFNFEKLINPPKYKPTKCANCQVVIKLGEDGYCLAPDGKYSCERCKLF